MDFTVIVALLAVAAIATSSLLYVYLHRKTRISLKYLYQDNVGVIIVSFLIGLALAYVLPNPVKWIPVLLMPGLVLGCAFAATMIRFFRAPTRRTSAPGQHIVSPADGNVIYIKKLAAGQVPITIKGKTISRLEEFTKTDLIKNPCWMVGVNLTPFDVHKNSAPISGRVVLNQHFRGSFLSLKAGDAMTDNERNTFVFEDETTGLQVGMVQIASKLVKKIESYVAQGDHVERGKWVGMIRFGSQVDIFIPETYNIVLTEGQQIYAGETVIALPQGETV